MASPTPSSSSRSRNDSKSRPALKCPHCKRLRAELPLMDKGGDPRLIRTWRRMGPKLGAAERERLGALLEKRSEAELTPGETDALQRLFFRQELANTVQSYVLCQGCHSLEYKVFFSSREHIRAVLRERDW